MYDLLVLAYGQPPKWVGAVGAIVFLIYFGGCIMHGLSNPKPRTRSLDLFEIGYILEPENQQQPSAPTQRKHDLYDDGVAILVSLGYKKTESKRMAQEVFDNNNVQTLQEFVVLVNKKD
tara:strand:+ start:4631 stop:4987 length:357 start_codon:yes stop_codon:yes gene_type:complete